MEPLEFVEKLAGLARKEPAPEVAVEGRVLVGIRDRQKISLVPLWIYAGWLAPMAAAVTFLAARVWVSLSAWLSSIYWAGPLDSFLSPLSQVMP
jgi:hypothetical protein